MTLKWLLPKMTHILRVWKLEKSKSFWPEGCNFVSAPNQKSITGTPAWNMNEAWSLPAPGIQIWGSSVEALFSKNFWNQKRHCTKHPFLLHNELEIYNHIWENKSFYSTTLLNLILLWVKIQLKTRLDPQRLLNLNLFVTLLSIDIVI